MACRAFPAAALAFAFACGPPRPKDNRVHVRFLAAPDAGGAARELARRFERAHPKIAVDVVEAPADSDTRENMYASSFMAREDVYDLVFMDAAWAPTLAARGWLLPLDARLSAGERRAFLAPTLQAVTYDGKLYGVPLQADAGVLYYRKDLLDARGLRPPRTWDELFARAKAARKPGMAGFVFEGKQYEGLVCSFLEVLRAYGADLDALTGPRAAAALSLLTGAIRDGLVPRAVLTYQEEEARRAFQEGGAVFMRNWPYAWRLMQAQDSPVRGKIGLAPTPAGPGGPSSPTLGGWAFALSAYSKHPDEAWLVASYFASEEAQRLAYRRAGSLPSRKALYSGDAFLAAVYPALREARPRPPLPRWPRVSDALQRHVSAALAGAETPEKALRAASEEIVSAQEAAR